MTAWCYLNSLKNIMGEIMQTIENDYAVTLPATAADETMQNNYGTSTGWSQWKLTERIAVIRRAN